MDALVSGAMIVALLLIGSAAWAGLRAAPFVPTSRADVQRMITLAHLQPGDVVVDLGCGDGRVVAAAASVPGVHARGYELSLLPFLFAKLRIARGRFGRRAEIRFGDFFHHDLSTASVIVCFLTPAAMPRLHEKIKREARPGTRIISRVFRIPGLPNERQEKPSATHLSIWAYTM